MNLVLKNKKIITLAMICILLFSTFTVSYAGQACCDNPSVRTVKVVVDRIKHIDIGPGPNDYNVWYEYIYDYIRVCSNCDAEW